MEVISALSTSERGKDCPRKPFARARSGSLKSASQKGWLTTAAANKRFKPSVFMVSGVLRVWDGANTSSVIMVYKTCLAGAATGVIQWAIDDEYYKSEDSQEQLNVTGIDLGNL
jgi:hypothetical protein